MGDQSPKCFASQRRSKRPCWFGQTADVVGRQNFLDLQQSSFGHLLRQIPVGAERVCINGLDRWQARVETKVKHGQENVRARDTMTIGRATAGVPESLALSL